LSFCHRKISKDPEVIINIVINSHPRGKEIIIDIKIEWLKPIVLDSVFMIDELQPKHSCELIGEPVNLIRVNGICIFQSVIKIILVIVRCSLRERVPECYLAKMFGFVIPYLSSEYKIPFTV